MNQATEDNQPERQDLVGRPQKKYETVFAKDIAGHNRPLINLELHQDASPEFLKARPVTVSMQSAYDEELRKLEQQDVIEPT